MVQQLELDTVVARLAAGETPESILATLRPAGERELLKRAVIVRTFDRPLFDSVLSADVATDEIPSFEQVVESRDVEALPRRDGVFRVRRGARTANWDAWWPEGTDTAVLPEPLTRLLSAIGSRTWHSSTRKRRFRSFTSCSTLRTSASISQSART
jgi:hypothetical protein